MWFTSENGDKFGPLNLSTPPLPQTMLLLLLPSAAFSIYNKESQKIGLKFNGDKPGWLSFQSFNLIVPLLLLFLFVRAGFMIAFYPFTIDRQTTKICFYQTSWRRLNYHRERFRKLTFWALALRQTEQRNCGVLWFIWECRGALPLVEIWSHEFVNKLVEWVAFIYSVWRDCTQLKNEKQCYR